MNNARRLRNRLAELLHLGTSSTATRGGGGAGESESADPVCVMRADYAGSFSAADRMNKMEVHVPRAGTRKMIVSLDGDEPGDDDTIGI